MLSRPYPSSVNFLQSTHHHNICLSFFVNTSNQCFIAFSLSPALETVKFLSAIRDFHNPKIAPEHISPPSHALVYAPNMQDFCMFMRNVRCFLGDIRDFCVCLCVFRGGFSEREPLFAPARAVGAIVCTHPDCIQAVKRSPTCAACAPCVGIPTVAATSPKRVIYGIVKARRAPCTRGERCPRAVLFPPVPR